MRVMLEGVRAGRVSVEEAVAVVRAGCIEELPCATIDHHRELRKGFPEVIYCAGKTPEQVAVIAERLAARSERVLGTRATAEQFAAARERVADLQYDASARCVYVDRSASPKHEGVAVVAAGTSDLPVADEAAVTLRVMGHEPLRITDVGVAGLHRILARVPELLKMRCVIVAAGMEGALPSVVAGLIPAPVIAVPTSVGYGASFGGLAALLGMLNSCASGIAVVNIDNGFGAAFMAAAINGQCVRGAAEAKGASTDGVAAR
ncbi:MAG TPA: nickel pincer cofactor biosynthesis protein LarB [Phycisphaerae bacterium]|nr:nickel pincer cofactor biosynthesis protein LarB [Phycisphaerae bacterium]